MIYTAIDYKNASQMVVTKSTANLSDVKVLEAQQIFGCILWCSWLVDVTDLAAVSKATTALVDRKSSINAQLYRLLGHLENS